MRGKICRYTESICKTSEFPIDIIESKKNIRYNTRITYLNCGDVPFFGGATESATREQTTVLE